MAAEWRRLKQPTSHPIVAAGWHGRVRQPTARISSTTQVCLFKHFYWRSIDNQQTISAAAPTFELSVEDYRALQRSANRGLRLSPSTSFDMIHNTPSLPPPGLSYFSGNIRPPVVPPLSRPSEIIRSSSIQYAAPLVQGWAPPVNVSPPVVIGWTPPAAVSPPVVIGWTPPTNLPLPLVMGWTPPIDIPQPVVPLPFNTPIGGDVGPCGALLFCLFFF